MKRVGAVIAASSALVRTLSARGRRNRSMACMTDATLLAFPWLARGQAQHLDQRVRCRRHVSGALPPGQQAAVDATRAGRGQHGDAQPADGQQRQRHAHAHARQRDGGLPDRDHLADPLQPAATCHRANMLPSE